MVLNFPTEKQLTSLKQFQLHSANTDLEFLNSFGYLDKFKPRPHAKRWRLVVVMLYDEKNLKNPQQVFSILIQDIWFKVGRLLL